MSYVRGGDVLGDLSADMFNAAQNATTVSTLPAHGVPYLTAYRRGGEVFINMNNPDESGDDTSNWVAYTAAFAGKTEEQKALFWGGKGAEVAIPGWTPQRAVDDPEGYQQALAAWRRANAEGIARETADVERIQAAERAARDAEQRRQNDEQARRDREAHEEAMRRIQEQYEASQRPPPPLPPSPSTEPPPAPPATMPVLLAPPAPPPTAPSASANYEAVRPIMPTEITVRTESAPARDYAPPVAESDGLSKWVWIGGAVAAAIGIRVAVTSSRKRR